MSKDTPGFDFITLTKSQWRWLKRIERDHGIPWYIYIRDLIKADMEGRLLSRSKKKKLITKDRVEEILLKIDMLLNRPAPKYVSASKPAEGQANFDAVFDETSLVKVSDLNTPGTDPNRLADGLDTTDLRVSLMDELHHRLGLPQIQRKKATIEFGTHIEITDAPDPPR